MIRRFLSLCVLALALNACSGLQSYTEVEALNQAKPTGSPFTQRLTSEYRSYMKLKQRDLDYADAKHFARKGLMAAQGKAVMPEPLSNWHLDDGSARELRAARTRLLQSLDGGGRIQAPFEAAVAQAKFDCWIEQQEQAWTGFKSPSCKGEFDHAVSELESRLVAAMPKSVKADEPVTPRAKAPVEVDPNAMANGLDEGMFLVFFDFNKSQLNDTGMDVAKAVVEQAKKRKNLKAIKIVGHTDTSGSDKYNDRLSQKRADEVKHELASMGIDLDLLTASGEGEKQLMVKTKNNTREPANRRVEVTFE